MKRSEFLQRLTEKTSIILNGHRVVTFAEQKIFLDRVLTMVVEQGMLPPNRFSTIIVDNYDMTDAVELINNYRWEPEEGD